MSLDPNVQNPSAAAAVWTRPESITIAQLDSLCAALKAMPRDNVWVACARGYLLGVRAGLIGLSFEHIRGSVEEILSP